MAAAPTRRRRPTSRPTSTTTPVWGVGLHPSIVTASLRAIVNAVNRALAQRKAVDEAAALFD